MGYDVFVFRRPAFLLCRSDLVAEIISSHQLEIITLANLSTLRVIGENDAAPGGCAVSVVNENLSVYLELQGTLSPEAELEKIRKKMDEIRKEKVPPHIHQENVAKLSSLMQEVLSLEEAGQHIEAQASEK
ncbi:valine--tRNA ligase, mitochondrial 1-like [Alnus glutinosa]|uniref:valine--tRNA ligase, mitochondrial 1-like n=1 Tax=Alnus glutinosa TaxID=3517 RepID=UPI002D783A21|nr:valine--tRNA ligase, mitochondrial 1-like [Alnus glutinosa]